MTISSFVCPLQKEWTKNLSEILQKNHMNTLSKHNNIRHNFNSIYWSITKVLLLYLKLSEIQAGACVLQNALHIKKNLHIIQIKHIPVYQPLTSGLFRDDWVSLGKLFVHFIWLTIRFGQHLNLKYYNVWFSYQPNVSSVVTRRSICTEDAGNCTTAEPRLQLCLSHRAASYASLETNKIY